MNRSGDWEHVSGGGSPGRLALTFSGLFTSPSWRRVVVLVTGALLTPHRRTVSSALGDGPRASHWLSAMLFVPLPWAHRVWALPFLTVLAPSERSTRESGRRYKSLTDWARRMMLQIARWLSGGPVGHKLRRYNGSRRVPADARGRWRLSGPFDTSVKVRS